MGVEAAGQFIQRMNSDAEFAKKVNSRKSLKTRAEFLRKNGYVFSQSEYDYQVYVDVIATGKGYSSGLKKYEMFSCCGGKCDYE